MRAQRWISPAVASALIVAACSGGDPVPPDSTVATTTTLAPAERDSDGVLRLGALLPQSDTRIGSALLDSITAAVADVNAAGGVLGNDVQLITRNEGESTTAISDAVVALIDEGVDAIVGPSSSVTAVAALDDTVRAGIVTCSPTASALTLDDYPDQRLFFRTIASDSLQAVAIADAAERTGRRDVAIVHVDDAYGRPYAAEVSAALQSRPLTQVTTIAIPVGDDDVDDDAFELASSGASVAIIVASPSDAARFLTALGRQEFESLSNIILNDQVRDPATAAVIAGLPDLLRLRITGIAPQITVIDDTGGDDESPFAPFAPQATDCVHLVALAAIQAGTDLPEAIASQMTSVSDGGTRCRTFETCATNLGEGRQIDYDGPTGRTELNREGETVQAIFETFRFDESGTAVVVDRVPARL
ncbi:MAG: ABC transporter substrate-binding protein [Ilumatobacter sp.]|uniref:ABC transporter substrate-binding protein n=1 Tax=Ilumatobacter sp. TaxID=1967498 RepID=UPI00391BEC4C